jgi:membrane protein
VKERLVGAFPVRVVQRYLNAQGPNWATLIAWNALFAFFPIVLVTITVVGIVLQDPGVKQTIEHQIDAIFPTCRQVSGGQSCGIVDALNSFRRRTGIYGVIGMAGLLWGGSGLFGAMDQAMGSLYPCKPRDFIPQKLMSFGMILLFTVLTVPLILSGSVLSFLERLPFVPLLLRTGPASLLLQIGAGILDASVLFGAIYYVVPHRRQRLRDVAVGSLLAAALFEGFTLLFPAYFRLAGGFATYGQTFALFFLLLFYFFVLGQIVMIGAAVNAELDPDLSRCEQGTGPPAGGLAPAETELRGTAETGDREVAAVGTPVGRPGG